MRRGGLTFFTARAGRPRSGCLPCRAAQPGAGDLASAEQDLELPRPLSVRYRAIGAAPGRGCGRSHSSTAPGDCPSEHDAIGAYSFRSCEPLICGRCVLATGSGWQTLCGKCCVVPGTRHCAARPCILGSDAGGLMSAGMTRRARPQHAGWCGRRDRRSAHGPVAAVCRRVCQRGLTSSAMLTQGEVRALPADAVVLTADDAADLSDRVYQV